MSSLYRLDQCATARSYEIKFEKSIDIDKISANFETLSKTNVVALLKINGKPVSLYASGRAMIKDVNKKEAEEIAEKLLVVID